MHFGGDAADNMFYFNPLKRHATESLSLTIYIS